MAFRPASAVSRSSENEVILSSICPAISSRTDSEVPRRRRVLVVPAWYPWPDLPGLGSFCRDQAEAVSRLHDVIVLTWRRDTGLSKPFVISEAIEDGLLTFRIRMRPASRPRLGTLLTVMAVLVVLARLTLRGWRADVVHAHEFQVGIPGIVAAAVSRAPLIISEHWSALALRRLQAGEIERARRYFRRATVVSPVSHDLARRIAGLTGTTTVTPVPNPVDTELFVPGEPRDSSSAVRLLAVGNLTAIKGHRVLVDAMGALVDSISGVSLDVVGDGELRDELEERARASGVAPHVRFRGRLSRHDVAAMMRRADILVLPSLWENLPCVLLEATSTGLPVVATRVGGTAEIVDASNGQLVEPGSETSLVDGIVQVISRRDQYDPGAMHQTADRRYGYGAIARTWTDVYEAAIAAFAGRRGRVRLGLRG
jgi:glycosyltransferase involved in cell wall biosynthesis